MRDPAENKDIEPSIGTLRDASDADRAIGKVYALIKRARDRMRVLALTRETERAGAYPSLDCCWARPRMWEQYGDEHRGVCLLFDRSRLERAICKHWPDERTRYFGDVHYALDGSAEIFRPRLDADKILCDVDRAQAIANHIDGNSKAFFFVKSDDFETEWEYRVVLKASKKRDDYAYIDYGDSLVGVVLGERFPDWQDPAAIRGCEDVRVPLGWLAWYYGRPRVFPRRPVRLSG